jgi:dipeptidase E
MSKSLLLLSNSTNHGRRYLEHAQDAVRAFFAGVGQVVFIPYALADLDGYTRAARTRFEELGLHLTGLHEVEDRRQALREAQGVFVGGGNSFRLLRRLQEEDLLVVLRERAGQGTRYMGASAGTNLACPTIRTTNDMPIVETKGLDALGLIPFQINPHYLDPDPGSTHMGETRETRLREYLEENERPVLGLREGSWLRVREGAAILEGALSARLFRSGREPRELPPGCEVLSELDF